MGVGHFLYFLENGKVVVGQSRSRIMTWSFYLGLGLLSACSNWPNCWPQILFGANLFFFSFTNLFFLKPFIKLLKKKIPLCLHQACWSLSRSFCCYFWLPHNSVVETTSIPSLEGSLALQEVSFDGLLWNPWLQPCRWIISGFSFAGMGSSMGTWWSPGSTPMPSVLRTTQGCTSSHPIPPSMTRIASMHQVGSK